MNNLGEHFTLSMSFISIFYKITPSINWMIGFKIIAYLSSVIFIWFLCREYIVGFTEKVLNSSGLKQDGL